LPWCFGATLQQIGGFLPKYQQYFVRLFLKTITCYRFQKIFSKIFAFTIDFLFFYDRIKTRFIKRKKMFGKFPS